MSRLQGHLLETLQDVTQQFINGLVKAYMISDQKVPFSTFKLKTNLMNFFHKRAFPIKIQPDGPNISNIPNLMDMSHQQNIPFNVKIEGFSEHELSLVQSKNYLSSSFKSSKKEFIQNIDLPQQNLIQECLVKQEYKNMPNENQYSQTIYHENSPFQTYVKDQKKVQNGQMQEQKSMSKQSLSQRMNMTKIKTKKSKRRLRKIRKQNVEVKLQENSIKSALRNKVKVQYQNSLQKQIHQSSLVNHSLDRSSDIKRQYQKLIEQKRKNTIKMQEQKQEKSQIHSDKQSDYNNINKSIDQDQIQQHSLNSSQQSSSSFQINQNKKNKYNSYPKQFKQEVVTAAKEFDIQHCHEVYQISKKSIVRWIKRSQTNKHKARGRKPIDPQMEKKLNQWLLSSIKKGEYKTQRQIRQAAVTFSNDQGFKASKGWLQKYFKRNTYITRGLYKIIEQRRGSINRMNNEQTKQIKNN